MASASARRPETGKILVNQDKTCLAPEHLVTDDEARGSVDRPREVPFGCRHVYLWAYSGRDDRSCTGISELSGGSREVTRNLRDAGEHEESCRSRLQNAMPDVHGNWVVRGQWLAKTHTKPNPWDEHSRVAKRDDSVIDTCEASMWWTPDDRHRSRLVPGSQWAGRL